MWLQRSRIIWLQDGDRNTKFFHRKAVWRARKNKIKKLMKPDGTWVEEEKELGCLVTDYFQKMYLKDFSLQPDVVLNLFPSEVTQSMNEQLCKEFTDEEISDALFQIGPLKSPGRMVSLLGFFRETGQC